MQPQGQKTTTHNNDNNNDDELPPPEALPALVPQPHGLPAAEKNCMQCERSAPNMSRCPLTGLWFCNEQCRLDCRATQPKLFRQMIRNNATKQQQQEPQPVVAVRKSARNVPKPIEIDDSPAPLPPTHARNNDKKVAEPPLTKSTKSASKKTKKARHDRDEGAKKIDRAVRREDREMEDGVAPPIRLVDTLSARQYRATEDMKRALRVSRLFWQRHADTSDAETNARRLAKLQSDRDALLSVYQQQIDTLNASMDALEQALEQWQKARLATNRVDVIQDWLRDDRDRVAKLRDVLDDIAERYSDDKLGAAPRIAADADAMVADALPGHVEAEAGSESHDEPDDAPSSPSNPMAYDYDDDNAAMQPDDGPRALQIPTAAANTNNNNNNNACTIQPALVMQPALAVIPSFSFLPAVAIEKEEHARSSPSPTKLAAVEPLNSNLLTASSEEMRVEEAAAPSETEDEAGDSAGEAKKAGGGDDGSEYESESSSPSEEIVQKRAVAKGRARVARTGRSAAPKRVVSPEKPRRRRTVLISDILSDMHGPPQPARGKKKLQPLTITQQPSSPAKHHARNASYRPLVPPANRMAPINLVEQQEDKPVSRKRRVVHMEHDASK